MGEANNQTVSSEWVSFPGGELEGERPKELCPGCREQAKRVAASSEPASRLRTLCFQCYRAELDRKRALLSAAELDTTTTVARFQTSLPFEPLNKPRLAMLKVERATAREAMRQGVGQFVDRRRQAQIAARRALQAIFAGVTARRAAHAVESVESGSTKSAESARLPEPAGGGAAGHEQGDSQSDPSEAPGLIRARVIAAAIRAAELQLPESWLPFVVSR
jgi:hypothetical protein